jgi:hypothetical protein
VWAVSEQHGKMVKQNSGLNLKNLVKLDALYSVTISGNTPITHREIRLTTPRRTDFDYFRPDRLPPQLRRGFRRDLTGPRGEANIR